VNRWAPYLGGGPPLPTRARVNLWSRHVHSARDRTGVRPQDLPPLDLIILSHHHGDHFDEVAIPIHFNDYSVFLSGLDDSKQLRRGLFSPPACTTSCKAKPIDSVWSEAKVTLQKVRVPAAYGFNTAPEVNTPLMRAQPSSYAQTANMSVNRCTRRVFHSRGIPTKPA
jgi:hypothetical protein